MRIFSLTITEDMDMSIEPTKNAYPPYFSNSASLLTCAACGNPCKDCHSCITCSSEKFCINCFKIHVYKKHGNDMCPECFKKLPACPIIIGECKHSVCNWICGKKHMRTCKVISDKSNVVWISPQNNNNNNNNLIPAKEKQLDKHKTM